MASANTLQVQNGCLSRISNIKIWKMQLYNAKGCRKPSSPGQPGKDTGLSFKSIPDVLIKEEKKKR